MCLGNTLTYFLTYEVTHTNHEYGHEMIVCLFNRRRQTKHPLETYSSDCDGRGSPPRDQYDSLSIGTGLPSPKHCSSMRYPTHWYTVRLLTVTIGLTVYQQQKHKNSNALLKAVIFNLFLGSCNPSSVPRNACTTV